MPKHDFRPYPFFQGKRSICTRSGNSLRSRPDLHGLSGNRYRGNLTYMGLSGNRCRGNLTYAGEDGGTWVGQGAQLPDTLTDAFNRVGQGVPVLWGLPDNLNQGPGVAPFATPGQRQIRIKINAQCQVTRFARNLTSTGCQVTAIAAT
jgi:hypothetical protein